MEEFIGMVRQNKSQSIIKVIEMGWFGLDWLKFVLFVQLPMFGLINIR